MMRVLDLFSGIGGFSLGLERTGGFETVAFCEIEPFCQRVLAKHWPGVPCYGDVRSLTAQLLRGDGIGIDVICGGFPCQDISLAGKGTGLAGERSGLWSEYARLIGELRPRYVIVENVAALLGRGLSRVLGDLAALGYDAEWHCIPAAAIGAPHRRDRLWIVGYPERSGRSRHDRRRDGQEPALGCADVADADLDAGQQCGLGDAQQGQGGRYAGGGDVSQAVADAGVAGLSLPQCDALLSPRRWDEGRAAAERGWWAVEPDVGRVAHGIPQRVDRLRGLGNAVVPQIPELIGRAILGREP